MQAVLKPLEARPNAARRPAPPAPTTTASYSWLIVVKFTFDADIRLVCRARVKVPGLRAERIAWLSILNEDVFSRLG